MLYSSAIPTPRNGVEIDPKEVKHMIWAQFRRMRLPVRFGVGGAVSARIISSLVGTIRAALRLLLPPLRILWAIPSALTDGTAQIGAF